MRGAGRGGKTCRAPLAMSPGLRGASWSAGWRRRCTWPRAVRVVCGGDIRPRWRPEENLLRTGWRSIVKADARTWLAQEFSRRCCWCALLGARVIRRHPGHLAPRPKDMGASCDARPFERGRVLKPGGTMIYRSAARPRRPRLVDAPIKAAHGRFRYGGEADLTKR